MRVWNMLFLVGTVALSNGTQVATAQNLMTFTVDGDPGDWGRSGHLSSLDDPFDVIPDTNSTVDIRQYGYGYGKYGPRGDNAPPRRELWAFIFKFLAPPFQGSEPTTVELFFDVSAASADPTFGDPTPPWREFRPEYRIAVTGQNGRLTTESYRRYTGGQWGTPTEGADIPEVEVALSGLYLEGAILWSALGSPNPDPMEPWIFSWAVQVSKGTYRDYLPDETSTPYPWDPLRRDFTTVEPMPWGKVKNFSD